MIKKSLKKEQSKLVDSGFLDSLGQDKDAIKMNKVAKVLIELAGGVMEDAANNLNTSNSVNSGRLISEMEQEITADQRFLETVVKMLDYGKFIDEGVNGTQNNRGSRFGFKNNFVGRKMRLAIKKWAVRENLSAGTFKRKIGKETKSGTPEDMAYAIALAIKKNGINKTEFMTKAINTLQQKLNSDKVLKAFKIDVIASLPDGSEFK